MSNPFEDDDDNDDYWNNRPGKGGSGGGGIPSYTQVGAGEADADEQYNHYERQIEESMQNSLASTNRSMKALEESEAVGVGTAEDLLVQREKLQNVDRRLDEINSTTAQTQRHLNNIKSVFGGLKNKFLKAPKDVPPPSEGTGSKLGSTVTKMKTDTSGFYSEDSATASSAVKSKYDASGRPEKTLTEESRQAIAGTRWGAMDDEIEENLDMMSANLRRLKQLGSALGDEIEEQNELLDNLHGKAEKTNAVVRGQDKQMKKILGYDSKKKKADAADATPAPAGKK